MPAEEAIEQVVTIFRELRAGPDARRQEQAQDARRGVLSTAEAISVLANSMALAGNFGTGEVTAHDLAAGLQGAVVKDEEKDKRRLAGVPGERAEEARGRVAAAVHRLLRSTTREPALAASTSSASATCRRRGVAPAPLPRRSPAEGRADRRAGRRRPR